MSQDHVTSNQQVQRFDCAGGKTWDYCQGCYHMEPTEHGDYVKYEDYDRLTRGMNAQADVIVQAQRELAAALIRVDELERANVGLATESERLTRERDENAARWRSAEDDAEAFQRENERLRAALTRFMAQTDGVHGGAIMRELHVIGAQALSGEPGSAVETSGWQPIETAPKDGRTLLLGYYNACGKWRTLRGQWFAEGSMDEWDGDEPDNNPAGWYETCVENDDPPNCWATEPTHWQPTPRPPEKASGGA